MYAVAQGDVDSGGRSNTAHVTATSPDGITSSHSDEVMMAMVGSAKVAIGETSI